MLQKLILVLTICLACLTSFQLDANAYLLTNKSYSINYFYGNDVKNGFKTTASSPISDLDSPDPNTAINKSNWVEFSADGGNGGFLETGALKGSNLIDLGTWIGFYYVIQTCSSANNCSYHAYKIGNYNPQGIGSVVYEIAKDTDYWKILQNGSVKAVTPYTPSNNAYRSLAGIENSGSLNTFTSGTNFTNMQGNNGSGWGVLQTFWFEYNTGSFPPGLDASFTYPFQSSSNIQLNSHS